MNQATDQVNQKKELRSFGLLTAALFVIIFGFGLPLLVEPESATSLDFWLREQLKQSPVNPWLELYGLPLWPWVLAIFLGFWALVWPIFLYPFFSVLDGIGRYSGVG